MLTSLPLQNLLFLGGLFLAIVLGLMWFAWSYIRTPDPWRPPDSKTSVSSIRDRLQTDEAKKKFDQLSRENEEIVSGEKEQAGRGVVARQKAD